MFGRNQVPDNALLKSVNQRIARTGTGGQSQITANVQGGTVTLTGSLQFPAQRIPIVKAAGRVEGVRGVVDQMIVVAKKRY